MNKSHQSVITNGCSIISDLYMKVFSSKHISENRLLDRLLSVNSDYNEPEEVKIRVVKTQEEKDVLAISNVLYNTGGKLGRHNEIINYQVYRVILCDDNQVPSFTLNVDKNKLKKMLSDVRNYKVVMHNLKSNDNLLKLLHSRYSMPEDVFNTKFELELYMSTLYMTHHNLHNVDR